MTNMSNFRTSTFLLFWSPQCDSCLFPHLAPFLLPSNHSWSLCSLLPCFSYGFTLIYMPEDMVMYVFFNSLFFFTFCFLSSSLLLCVTVSHPFSLLYSIPLWSHTMICLVLSELGNQLHDKPGAKAGFPMYYKGRWEVPINPILMYYTISTY